jgi:hypothetical protein
MDSEEESKTIHPSIHAFNWSLFSSSRQDSLQHARKKMSRKQPLALYCLGNKNMLSQDMPIGDQNYVSPEYVFLA